MSHSNSEDLLESEYEIQELESRQASKEDPQAAIRPRFRAWQDKG